MIVSRRFVKAIFIARRSRFSATTFLVVAWINPGGMGAWGRRRDQSFRTSSRVLPMTVRLESSMAVAATNGVSRPLMATGMAIRL